jgi:hypothetical protein
VIRIDVDNFVIMRIQCGDHQHRYAVPSHYTCRMTANRVWEELHTKKEERRTPSQQFTLVDNIGRVQRGDAVVSALWRDDSYVVVVPVKEEG